MTRFGDLIPKRSRFADLVPSQPPPATAAPGAPVPPTSTPGAPISPTAFLPVNVPQTARMPMPARPDALPDMEGPPLGALMEEPIRRGNAGRGDRVRVRPEPEPVEDLSTAGGDFRAGMLQVQQLLPGARAGLDIAEIGRIQDERQNAARLREETLAQAAALEAELPNLVDDDARAMVLDEIASLRQRAGQMAITETMSMGRPLGSLIEEAQTIAGLNQQIAEIPMNPAARAIGEAETFAEGFSALGQDPLGAIRSFGLRSLPASAPSITGAVLGQFLGGPTGAAILGGAGGGLTEAGLSVANDVGMVMAEAGVDLTDPAAIETFIQANPEAFAGAVETALVRAGVIGAADAATAGIAGTIISRIRNGTRFQRAAAVPAVAVGVEAPGEMAGEAAAQLATTGEIQPGEVMAEGLGAVGQGSVQTLGQTIAEAMRAQPQVTPPAQPPAPTVQVAEQVVPVTDSPVTPSQPVTQLPQPLPLTPEQRVAVQQPPVQEQNVPAPEAPPSPDAATPAEVDGPRVADVVPRPPRPQARPFTNLVKRSGIRIDPQGPAGRELAANGITPRTLPGLFRKGGLQSIDNLPASEYPQIRALLGAYGEEGQYLDQQAILDALADEAVGNPLRDAEQLARAAAWDAYQESASEIYQEYAQIGEAQAPSVRVIPSPDVDISTGSERIGSIQTAVRATVQEYTLGGILTDEEVGFVVNELDQRGGDVLAAIENTAMRRILNAEEGEPIGAPAVDAGAGLPDPTRSVGDAIPEAASAGGVADPQRLGAFPTELTPEGEQAVIPGTRETGLTEAEDRARREAAVRQQQSMMRRGGQEGVDTQEGGLFAAPQDDLFTAPSPPPQPATQAPRAPMVGAGTRLRQLQEATSGRLPSGMQVSPEGQGARLVNTRTGETVAEWPAVPTAEEVIAASQPTVTPSATPVDRNTDVRGTAFAVTDAEGNVIMSGSTPSLADPDETNRAGYFMDMADRAGGALFIGPVGLTGNSSGSVERIFGMTWEEIQAKQQGQTVTRPVRSKMPGGAVEVYRAKPKRVDPGPRDTGATADMGDYGPKPGRRPPGKLSPGFVKFSFNNKPSVYNAAFRDAGVDPDAARQKPLEWQMNLLKRQIEARYGIKVEVGQRAVVRKNLLGRKVEAQSPDLQARKAIDQMLDAYQTLEMLAAVMGVPTKALSLPIDGKPLTLSLTSTSKLRGALGMFSYGGGKRVIHMPGRSNSFAHEWGHALDHYLNTEVGRINVPEEIQNDSPDMLSRKAVRQGLMQPFSHKRPLTQAFAYMMQGLYGDRAQLAQLQLKLQLEVAQVDASGQPTPAAKNAQKILQDIQQGKAPPPKYLNEFYKSSAEYDQAVGAGGYFTDPAEMFARAFEAFVGREVARQTDAPQNFLSKGSWAYDDTNDQRAALTFPKGTDAEGFAVGMTRLSQALMAVSDLGPGEAPVFPKQPEMLSPMTIDRPAPPAKWMGAWYQREVNSWGQLVGNIFQSVKILRTDDDAARLEHHLARLFMRHVINSGSGALHDIARNYDGKARQAIDNIAMKIGTRPGYGQVTNDIWQQEMEAYALAKLNYVQNEVKKVYPDGDIPKKHQKQLRAALLGKTTLYGETIPPTVMGLARKLNQVTDRIWYDLDSTGHKLGYQRGYLPFVYHLGKVDANPDGFKAQAKKVYALMFTREVHDNADPEEQLKDVNRAIRQLSKDFEATPKGTKFQKSWLTPDDETLIGNWRDARRKVKDIERKIAKEMEAERPRADVLDKLRAQLQEAGDRAATLYGEVMNMLRDRWSDYSVEHWYVAQGVGRINDFDTMGPSANFLQGRRFPPEAAEILNDYMIDDPMELMQGYIFGASRRIHYAKAFGAPTMTDDGEEIGADLKTMLQAARAAGVRAEDIDTIKTAVNAATGRMRGDVMGWVRAVSRIGAYGQMALLTLAPLSSLAEPITVGLRSGSVRDSLKGVASNLRNIVQSGRRRELYDLARFIGMVADYTAETVMANRMAIDAMSLSDRDRARVAKFHQMTGLTPLTNFNRISNLPVADGIIRRLLRDAVRGERTVANRARDAIAGGAGKFADGELNELGISQEDRAPLLAWLESLGGMPRQEDLLAPDGSMHEAARIWSRAVRRLTNETIQNTMKSDRAIAANSPFLATMYSIMSFIDGFHRNILLRNLRRGVSEDAGVASWERLWKGGANVALMAMPAGMLFAGQVLATMLRESLLNAQKLEEMDDDELLEYFLLRAWSRTGLVGRFDPLIQVSYGIKYENDLTGLIAGPYNSFFAGQLQTVMEAAFGRNSANTNTTEWNAAQSVYRGLVQPLAAVTVTSLFPASGSAGLLGTSALYYLGRYDTSRSFADTLVGEKGRQYDKEGLEATPWWELGDGLDITDVD